jgi:hypothetical protein
VPRSTAGVVWCPTLKKDARLVSAVIFHWLYLTPSKSWGILAGLWTRGDEYFREGAAEYNRIMRRFRKRTLLMVGVLIVAVSCGSVAPLSDDELAECTVIASSDGTIGGSATLVSTLVLRLPDDVVSSEGAFDVAFNEEYGISLDQFLVLRNDADAATSVQYGDPPSVGERVSDEWFVQRDVVLMQLWNEGYPTSATTFCDLVRNAAGRTP